MCMCNFSNIFYTMVNCGVNAAVKPGSDEIHDFTNGLYKRVIIISTRPKN